MGNSLAIKNLAIACEALSRVNGMHNELHEVQFLLNHEIANQHKENREQTKDKPTTDDEI